MKGPASARPRRLGRRVVYRHPWLSLYVDKVRLPGGRLVDHHVVDFHRRSVAVVVEDARRRILMIRAVRYVTGTNAWEVPAGLMEPGESILAAARREVREESGYGTRSLRRLYTFFPIGGIANKVFHVARARATRGTGVFDVNEVREVRWFSRREIGRLLERNAIRDGYTLVALLMVMRKP